MALRVSWACNLNFHTVTYNVQSVQKWNEYVRYEKSTTTTISSAHVCKLSRTCNRVRNKANTLIDAKHRGYPTPFIICCDGMRDDHNVSDCLTDCQGCKVIS